MIRKHLLIAESHALTPKSLFILLWCGISKKAVTRYKILLEIAAQKGWFLRQYSHEVSEFVDKVAQSMGTSVTQLNWASYNIMDDHFLNITKI